MSLPVDDFDAYRFEDPDDDEETPLGDALAECALGVETDTVDAVRNVRERT